jgi:hypothetical protein
MSPNGVSVDVPPPDDAALTAALVAALGQLEDPTKAGHADTGSYQYAYLTLPQLLAAVRPVFAAHGLAVAQTVQRTDLGVAVTTIVLHESGQERVCPPLELRCGPGAQDTGSAITYARRYTLAALTGLAGDDDDDGARAQRSAPPPAKVTVKAAKSELLDAVEGDRALAASVWAAIGAGSGPYARDELERWKVTAAQVKAGSAHVVEDADGGKAIVTRHE